MDRQSLHFYILPFPRHDQVVPPRPCRAGLARAQRVAAKSPLAAAGVVVAGRHTLQRVFEQLVVVRADVATRCPAADAAFWGRARRRCPRPGPRSGAGKAALLLSNPNRRRHSQNRGISQYGAPAISRIASARPVKWLTSLKPPARMRPTSNFSRLDFHHHPRATLHPRRPQ